MCIIISNLNLNLNFLMSYAVCVLGACALLDGNNLINFSLFWNLKKRKFYVLDIIVISVRFAYHVIDTCIFCVVFFSYIFFFL